MTDSKPRTFTARCSEDLLATVPYLLGFHPQDSLVLLTFGAQEGSFHARVDLPVDLAGQREVAALLHRTVLRHRVPRVAVVLYTSEAAAAVSQAGILLDLLLADGVEVVEVLRADGERWYAAPEMAGAGTPYDLSSHPFTAERVFHGDAVHGSRRELAESLVGTPDLDTARAAEAHAERTVAAVGRAAGGAAVLREEARWVQRRIRQHLRDGRPLGTDDAGRLLALSSLVQVRDVAWSEMAAATAPQHVGLWRDLVRRCPPELLPGAGSLLAFAAWLAGQGALAWCALDRVAEVDPDYSMARCVAACLTGALPPSVWTPVPEDQLPAFCDV